MNNEEFAEAFRELMMTWERTYARALHLTGGDTEAAEKLTREIIDRSLGINKRG